MLNKMLVLVNPESLTHGEIQEFYIEKISQLAVCSNAFVELYAPCYNSSLHNSYRFDHTAEKEAIKGYLAGVENALVSLSEQLQVSGVSCGYDLDWCKDYAYQVVKKAQDFGADLVTVPLDFHKGSYILNQGQWKLITDIEQPLLVVQGKQWAEHPRIAAAIDPFHPEDQSGVLEQSIISTFKELSSVLEAEQHIVHTFVTVPQAVIFNEHLSLDYANLQEGILAQHKEALHTFIVEQELANAITHLERGEFHLELVKICSEHNLDMVVMGSVARGALDRMLIGSSVERVMGEVNADLLLIKQPNQG